MLFSLIIIIFPSLSIAAIGVTTIDGQEILLYEYSYALVVGNSEYQNFDKLPGAMQDARDVAKALKRKGFTVELALNLTRDKFDSLFTDFTMNRGKHENTRMLFYYAGHGTTLPMAGNETMGYLVMADTPKPDKNPAGFITKSIDMQYMVLKCKLMKARHVLYMFDSCFSGTLLNFREDSKPSQITHRIKYPVRQFITAGSADEPVPDRSYFKQVFLDLIEGRIEEPYKDGYITGEELGQYLKYKVPYYFRYQHPQFGKIKNPHLDKGDFVFLAGGVTVIEEPDDSSQTGSLAIDTIDVPQIEITVYNRNGIQVYEGSGHVKITNLNPGRYIIMAKASGYSDKKKTVQVSKGRQARVRFIMEQLKSRIFVDSNPPDAQIRILHILSKYQHGIFLPPGRYELEASHPNYLTLNKWVILNANEDLTVEMNLQAKKKIAVKTFTNQFGMCFVLIPAGSFMMGSPKHEEGRDNTEIQHRVTLTKYYYMQTTEVTQGQWKAVMGNNPSYFKNCGDNCPVECISWDNVQQFIKKLNRKDRTARYRLPSEAEWEYAARAGTTTRFFWGNQASCFRAHYGKYSGECQGNKEGPTAVMSYPPNAWGLYDMHGNVWECCQDYYEDYSIRSRTDPTGPSSGVLRIFRGGGWRGSPKYCRSSVRGFHRPAISDPHLGARLAAFHVHQIDIK